MEKNKPAVERVESDASRSFPRERCHVWARPSFRPSLHFHLLETPDQYVVRRLMKESGINGEPETVISKKEATLDYTCGKALFSTLESLQCNPLDVIGHLGCDGTSHGIVVERWTTRVEFSWWGSVSDGWLPLERWYFDVIDACSDALGETYSLRTWFGGRRHPKIYTVD